MEAFFLLFAAGVVFGPLVLSIIALTQSSKARREVQELAARLRSAPASSDPAPAPESSAPAPAPAAKLTPPPAARIPKPPSVSPPAPPVLPPDAKPEAGLEVAVGARVASFVGIAVVVISIVFFVGYAIQNNWIGPGARVLAGLVAGAGLVAAGHAFSRKGDRHAVLARALTGGGAALFYFTVFAAYRVYHLIGATVAGAGLAASAAGVLALALIYNSQAVALLGVLGAFITPLLVVSHFGKGIFPLVYVAVVNVPVLLLGVRRAWGLLGNFAFLFTILYAAFWLDDALPGSWRAGLLFVSLFHAQFAGLSFLQSGRSRGEGTRFFDLFRLSLSGALLGLALYYILGEAQRESWRGAAFALAALAHAAVSLAARRRSGGLRDEALAFAGLAIAFAGFALPVHFDGPWVSLGWAIEGVALAALGLRARSGFLQAAAIGLGLLGPFKSLCVDITLFGAPPEPFRNSRFAVGLISAGLLGVQSWLHSRSREDDGSIKMYEALALFSLIAGIGTALADAWWTLPRAWPMTDLWMTAVLLAGGVLAAALSTRVPLLGTAGFLLLLAVPVKLVLVDAFGPARLGAPFRNEVVWLRLLLPLAASVWLARRGPARRATTVAAVSIIATVLLVTLEIQRVKSSWAGSAVTIFWAVSALVMTVVGLVRRWPWLRYIGLSLFGLTVAKLFLVDLADLRGLQRIAAFLGVGLLLLFVSYLYQRVAPVLMNLRPRDGVTEK